MRTGLAVFGLLASAALVDPPACAQGLTRTELQKIDYPAGFVTQSYLVAVPAKGVVAPHTHPGIELGYLVSGAGTVSLQGQADRNVKAGDSWVFPAGAVHSLRNTGDAPEQIVVTYVLEKGKPLATPVR